MKVLTPRDYASLTFIRILTIMAYVTGLLFLFAAGLLLGAWDLASPKDCYVGVELCFAFYVTSKLILYVFREYNHPQNTPLNRALS